ncbi:hypothetical protein CASFOL_027779 [Castilleja foliolosa]|uniref:F-box domain-containing protein n=1 Tax=Castilleja foliolosa TaxID=1961234 RepID=A0ABD3CFS8_9LAMI
MANCVLPEDVMLCILTRLPVKTILRFKSVCKPWCNLFSTPEFRKLHHGQFSRDPKNQSFILHSFRKFSNPVNKFSIFSIESNKKKPTIVDHPFAHTQNIELDTLGCCSGLVCLRIGQDIVLWNPAMKLSKNVPIKACGPLEIVSLGFGYDAAGDDFKVVKIIGKKRDIEDQLGMSVTSVEIYSVSLDSWIAINVGFQFSEFRDKNVLIVSGNPYWFACVDGNLVLVCFDVMELVFKIVPTINCGLDEEKKTLIHLVDWNGALGSVSYFNKSAIVENLGLNCFTHCARFNSLCVWVFDVGERVWRKIHIFGPTEKVDVFRVFLCTKNEKVLGAFSSGTLFVLDLETGCVNNLFDGVCNGESFYVYGYTESLTYIKGMTKVIDGKN